MLGKPGPAWERARTTALSRVNAPEGHAWRPPDPALARR